ncbi:MULTISPECIES: SCO2322 family protein [unclassified Streptomyces]|uniref:SCO2322 family protein n=1 Tax=unclassified Streptomyces TaxID=2593676 RepID=UPI0004BD0F63|nr:MULTISPECIES: SCO2322 family protein [unclassified Streptomyces]
MIRRAVLLLLAALVLCAGAGQAQAAGYRYWVFWERDGDHWVYATQGPSTSRPSDGAVQGLRFAVSEDSANAARPRGDSDFDTICAKTPARDGKKRVALLIDFGTKADAPSGETPPATRTACARVSPDATTADALAAVAKPLRYDTNALLCAIAAYPEKGCGEQVSQKHPPTKKQTKPDNGPSLGLLAGIAVIVLLGTAAIWQVRRRA